MFWWDTIKRLGRQLRSMELEKDNYKSMFNSLSDTCDMHVTYIEELKAKVEDLKGNPPRVEPPPKYKEDLQGEMFQKIFTHGHASLMFEMGDSKENVEELEAAFSVLKNIKPFKPVRNTSNIYQDQLLRRQAAMAQSFGVGGLAGMMGAAAMGHQQAYCHRGLF